jgi:predicted ATPase
VRFQKLHVSNFRAISNFDVDSLERMVIIAGPNGCGKSQVLDAIRLLKSAYGGYQTNESAQWFGEFQMAPNETSALFRDKNIPVRISASIELAEEEKLYLQANAYQVLEPIMWAEVTRQPIEVFQFSLLAYTAQYPQLVPMVAQQTLEMAALLATELNAPSHSLSLTIEPNSSVSISPSLIARVIFQTFKPDDLGIIDFHSAQRIYTREGLGGINLDLKAIEGQRRVQTLYNYQAKYANVKSELVATYVRDLVAKDAGLPSLDGADLNETLKELFRTFFPHKKYMGIQIDLAGTMSFPVELSTGERHDINDLSSGEKEILYGYLRLRNSTPHHSTILFDEPEMHLNPALLVNLPDFYYRHLAQSNDNQVWLVTHSDALLRHAVGKPNYSVYHMTNAVSVESGHNQVLLVAEDELQAVLVDLVGDLAAYRPFAKVLIFEGEAGTEFDVSVIQRLFPGLAERVTLVSGGSKGRVNDLYAVLARTAEQVGLTDKYYAITDRDSTPSAERQTGTHVLSWDVYHIENYLLSARHILKALSSVGSTALDSVESVEGALKLAAEGTLEELVLVRLQTEVNDRLVQSIVVKGGNLASPANALLPSIDASYERIEGAKSELANLTWLETREREIRDEFVEALDRGEWIKTFPGRAVLKKFVSSNCGELVKYEGFVSLIIEFMVIDNFKPAGMVELLSTVVSNP